MTDYEIVISYLKENPEIELAEICDVTGLSIDFVMDCEEIFNK